MSIHSSLAGGASLKKQRSVLKRFERVKKLQAEGIWNEQSSVFKLPKTKILRLKLKKTKKADKAAETEAKK